MPAVVLGLAVAAVVLGSAVPGWLDPLVLLLGFVSLRVEARRLPLLVLLLAGLHGASSLDPIWLHLLLGGAGAAGVWLLRRWFYASRPVNQVGLTFLLGMVLHAGAAVPLWLGYPHVGRGSLLGVAAATAGLTALAAPPFYLVVDRVLMRPRHLRRGLVPATGG